MSHSPDISVIIVTCNSLPALTSCLTALAASTAAARCEIIGVDNASLDRSADEFCHILPNATVMRNAVNVGFARACNQGAAVARGNLLLFLNPDTQIDSGAVEVLSTVCRADAGAGLVSGRLRFPDGHFQPTCRELPTVRNLLSSRGSRLSKLSTNRRGRGSRYTLPDCSKTTEVPVVAATMVMIRRVVFEEVGGFDPRFFLFMEDTDLSLRLRQAGYRNFFVPEAGAVHLWGEGATAGRIERLRHHHCSVWRYFAKHQPGLATSLLLPMMLLVNFVLSAVLPAGEGRS